MSTAKMETPEQLILFTKLFIIMGLTWVTECIHVMVHGDHTNNEHCYFYIEVSNNYGAAQYVMYFDQLSAAACTQKLVKTLF